MKRRKLLAALAGWLAVPALSWAQTEGPRFMSEVGPPRIIRPNQAVLPDPDAPMPKTVMPETKIKPLSPTPTATPTTDSAAPKKVEPKPAATIVESPNDPNQRWLRPPTIEDGDGTSGAHPIFDARPNQLVWVTAEWLVWKTTGSHVPPLVTASSVGAAQSDAGVLHTGDTRVLFGNEPQLKAFRSGLRARAGFWLDPTQTFGIDATLIYLGQKSKGATFTTSGDIVSVARPYFDAVTNIPASEVVAFSTVNADGSLSSVVSGTIIAKNTSDFWGTDINFRRYFHEGDSWRLDGLLGFRYQRLRDTLETNSLSTINTASAIGDLSAGTLLHVQDLFHTTSNFYGGQLGLVGDWRYDRWMLEGTAKVAFGGVQDEVRINGLMSITPPDQTAVVTPGGLLTQDTNIGRHRTSRFSIISEVGLTAGYQLASNMRIFAGYSVLYWTNVVRPGDQIDVTINTTQLQRTTTTTATLDGPPRPAYGAAFRESGFWAYGGNLGLEFRW